MIEGQLIVPAFEAHRFRGEYLDCFARIEDHLTPVIERLVKIKELKKAPFLFGQKFDLVFKNSSAEDLWRNRHHVIPILDDLQVFADLRGLVGHATIKEIDFDGCPAISLRNPGDASWQSRRVFTNKECDDIINQLKTLTSKLLRQRLTVAASPALPAAETKPAASTPKAQPSPPAQPWPGGHQPPAADI